jgi:hypothetical protein
LQTGLPWRACFILEHHAKYLNHFTLPETLGFNAQSDAGMSQVFRSIL